MATLELGVDPVPAARPKVSKWGTYYPKSYATWLKAARAHIRRGHLDLEPDAPLLVVVEQVCKKPRTTKRLYPTGDVDNHAKGPLDVVTKVEGWWHDDDQINWLLVSKRFADPGEKPRTVLEIYSP